MAYRRDDIERVRDATDLVELVEELTKVRRSGRSGDGRLLLSLSASDAAEVSADGMQALWSCLATGRRCNRRAVSSSVGCLSNTSFSRWLIRSAASRGARCCGRGCWRPEPTVRGKLFWRTSVGWGKFRIADGIVIRRTTA